MYRFALISCFKVEAVDLISEGKAPRIVQPDEGATYDKIWKKKDVAKVMVKLFVVSKLVNIAAVFNWYQGTSTTVIDWIIK